MTLPISTDGSAGPTAGAGSGISAPSLFRLAIRLIAGDITAGALPAEPIVVPVHLAAGAR